LSHAASVQGSQQLSILGAVVVVAGLVIGAGIFKTPSLIAGLVADTQIVWIWVAAAVLSLIGALCYVELITRFPSQRGELGFLSEAFGPRLSFVYGWAKATVINPGAIAMLAFVLADYWTPLWPGLAGANVWLALAVILVLTAVNFWGLRFSARLQLVLLGMEVILLVVVSVVALSLAGDASAVPPALAPAAQSPSLGAIGLAMIFALLTFGGWNEAAYLVRDLRGGQSQMLKVLVLSLALITAVYLLVNLALIHLLGAGPLAQSKAPIGDLASRVFGDWGTAVVLAVVSASILTSINATMVVGARATASMAEEWAKLDRLSRWREARGTPIPALVFQSAVSLILVAFASVSHGAFAALVEFTAPVYWGFLCLVGVSLLLLRRRFAQAQGFVLPLGPALPLVFILSSAYLTYSSLSYAESQGNAWVSVAVVAVGVLVSVFLGRAQPAKAEG